MALGFTTAGAITVDDLDGKLCLQTFVGNHAQSGLYQASFGGRFEKINSTQLWIHDFYGAYKVKVNLQNNKLSIPVYTNTVENFFDSEDGTGECCLYRLTHYACQYLNDGNYYAKGYWFNNNSSVYTSESYSDLAQGKGFMFKETPFAFQEDDNTGITNEWCFYQLHIRVADANYMAVEDDGSSYWVNIEQRSDSKYALQNFFNQGQAYNIASTPSNTYTEVALNIASDKSITVDAQKIGGCREANYFGYQTWQDGSNGYFEGYAYTAEDVYHHNWIYSGTLSRKQTIKGEAMLDNGIKALKLGHPWLYDPETEGTEAGIRLATGNVFRLDDVNYDGYRLTRSGKTITNLTGSFNTLYFYDPANDITPTFTTTVDTYGFGKGRKWNTETLSWEQGTDDDLMWFQGHVDCDNMQYIDRFELYAVPGKFTDVSHADFRHENGHAKALNISAAKYRTDYNPDGLSHELNPANGTYFNRFVQASDFRAAGIEPNAQGDYTLFVRAYFKDGSASGIRPLALSDGDSGYGGMSGVNGSDGALTAVDDILAGAINNDNAPKEYYDLNGAQVPAHQLRPGMYICRQGTRVTKTIIR